MVKVSIIVPVYNTSKYLEKCLNSILNQTFNDYEIIVIDDGSTDGSTDIIKDYLNKNCNIRAFFQRNKGRGYCRNKGIKLSKGEYICFLDSDDYVQQDFIEKLYTKINNNHFDIVMCNYYTQNDEKTKKISINIKNDLCSKFEIKRIIPSLNNMLWNKMYKADLLKNIKFNEQRIFEDVDFLYRLYPNLNSIGIVTDYLYYYCIREKSVTNVFDDRWLDLINSMDDVLNYFNDNKLYYSYYEELEYIYVRYLYATIIKNISKSRDYKKLFSVFKKVKKLVREHFPNYKSNSYINEKKIKNIYLKYFNSLFINLLYVFT